MIGVEYRTIQAYYELTRKSQPEKEKSRGERDSRGCLQMRRNTFEKDPDWIGKIIGSVEGDGEGKAGGLDS